MATGLNKFIKRIIFFAITYTLIYFDVLPLRNLNNDYFDLTFHYIPWWMLISFGSYSLSSIGYGLLTFKDCPNAYIELLNEISLAKDDLRSKGVDVD